GRLGQAEAEPQPDARAQVEGRMPDQLGLEGGGAPERRRDQALHPGGGPRGPQVSGTPHEGDPDGEQRELVRAQPIGMAEEEVPAGPRQDEDGARGGHGSRDGPGGGHGVLHGRARGSSGSNGPAGALAPLQYGPG